MSVLNFSLLILKILLSQIKGKTYIVYILLIKVFFRGNQTLYENTYVYKKGGNPPHVYESG